MLDELKQKLSSGVIVLGVPGENKVNLIAGVTSDLVGRVKSGELVNFVASQVGGKGGGRPDMAQAGGTQPENLENALSSVYKFIEEKI
jgi:alanyl-tRNA synthetase